MWESTEWAEDPEGVMGAIFAAACKPWKELLNKLNKTKLVDGCWEK